MRNFVQTHSEIKTKLPALKVRSANFPGPVWGYRAPLCAMRCLFGTWWTNPEFWERALQHQKMLTSSMRNSFVWNHLLKYTPIAHSLEKITYSHWKIWGCSACTGPLISINLESHFLSFELIWFGLLKGPNSFLSPSFWDCCEIQPSSHTEVPNHFTSLLMHTTFHVCAKKVTLFANYSITFRLRHVRLQYRDKKDIEYPEVFVFFLKNRNE